jgi:hypothetical protein
MDNIEFKEKVEELFKEFDKDDYENEYYVPNFIIKDGILLQIYDTDDYENEYHFTVRNDEIRTYLFHSSKFKTLEEFYDEIIIFKEIHLDKYL